MISDTPLNHREDHGPSHRCVGVGHVSLLSLSGDIRRTEMTQVLHSMTVGYSLRRGELAPLLPLPRRRRRRRRRKRRKESLRLR